MIAINAYRERAERHAPRTVAELREAAREMSRAGYGDHTIGEALRLDVAAVRRPLGTCQDCES